jgi:PAS domain S-box-containing protein
MYNSSFEGLKINDLIKLIKKRDVIIDLTHDGLMSVNKEGIIELFNKTAEKILGLNRNNVVGRNVQDVIANTRLHIVLEKGNPELNKVQNIKDIKIITSRVPIRDDENNIVGAIAIFRDITEMKKLAEEITNLKEIRVMLEAIINSTQDAISVVDENGIGILINPAYTRLTGLTTKDIIGKPATVDIAEGKSMHYQVLKTKKSVRGVRMKVGPLKKDVIVDVAPIIVDGKLNGSVGVVKDLSEIKKLNEELDQARRFIRHLKAKYTFDDIIGDSQTLRAVIKQAKRASQTSITVLLRGESGTGKELFAHAIHNESPRKNEKFIRVNCAAIADSILESELFGYEEGAFTGAVKGGKKGLFEEADKGTIFLDEIGKVSFSLQDKLLRVLQEKEIIKVGGVRTIEIDVRIIVASNTNLERAIQEGKFREDLYYRLNVFPLFIPSLRERREDIPLLVSYIIRKFNQEYGRSVKECAPEAMKRLMDYDWPGNVRELENVIGRAMINLGMERDMIQLDHLPILGMRENKEYNNHIIREKHIFALENHSLKDIMNETEKKVIIQSLEKCNGNRTEVAKILGIAIRSLYYKLDKYGIE